MKEDRHSDAYRLAAFMHNNYEYFAAKHNWRTNQQTRNKEFETIPVPNQLTMLELAAHLIRCFDIKFDVIVVKKETWLKRLLKKLRT